MPAGRYEFDIDLSIGKEVAVLGTMGSIAGSLSPKG